MDSSSSSLPEALASPRRHALRLARPLRNALLVSFALHALLFGSIYLGILFKLPFAIEFTESAGIGMIDRIGRLHEGEFAQTAPRYTNIDLTLPAYAPPEAAEPPPASEEEAAPPEEAASTGEDDANAQRAAEEREAEEAAARAEARRRRRERERLAERQAQAEADARAAEAARAEEEARAAAESETPPEATEEPSESAEVTPDATPEGVPGETGPQDAGPDLSLPPGERYPAGTINPVATDLGMWGPEGARIVVVLRNDRLRGSAHVETANNVLQSFPDWRRLAGGAELKPLDDLDTIVVASSDPNYINRTFFVATHHMPSERVVATLSSGDHASITWEVDRGRLIGRPVPRDSIDPRVFFVPSEKVFAFTRPEYMDALRGDLPRARGMDGALETAEAVNRRGDETADARIQAALVADQRVSALRPSDEPPLKDQGWLAGLMRLGDYGGTGRSGPAIMISTGQIAGMRINGYRGAMPQGFHANVFADRNPRITARAIFQNKEEAESFKRDWPNILDANRSSLSLIGLYRPLSEATLSVDHNETIIEFTINEATVRRLGVTVAQLMETR